VIDHALCEPCAARNFTARTTTVDLRGRRAEAAGFVPPLDVVDGAARGEDAAHFTYMRIAAPCQLGNIGTARWTGHSTETDTTSASFWWSSSPSS
jgi:hypothetical protein